MNGVVRYSRGDARQRVLDHRHGLSRHVELDRSGAAARDRQRADRSVRRARSDRRRRYVSLQRHRSSGSGRAATRATKVTAYGIGYDLNLFSNFTFFLDDPDRGDQFQQADHRFVTGGKVDLPAARPTGPDREMQNTFGVQLRNDDITNVGLYHTAQRQRARARRARTRCCRRASPASRRTRRRGRRGCARSPASASTAIASTSTPIDPANSGTEFAGLVSPKGGVVIGPFDGTELYANAGLGFHSNDARGATITRDPATGEPADRVTPLVRANGAEVGVRTVAIPHLQTQPRGLDAEPRLGADLRRRRGHDRGGAPEPSLRRRVGELLHAASVADLRRRRLVVARALHRRRSGGRPHSRVVETVVSAGATVDSRAQRLRQRARCATSGRGR